MAVGIFIIHNNLNFEQSKILSNEQIKVLSNEQIKVLSNEQSKNKLLNYTIISVYT
jgi:hypothetical protein